MEELGEGLGAIQMRHLPFSFVAAAYKKTDPTEIMVVKDTKYIGWPFVSMLILGFDYF